MSSSASVPDLSALQEARMVATLLRAGPCRWIRAPERIVPRKEIGPRDSIRVHLPCSKEAAAPGTVDQHGYAVEGDDPHGEGPSAVRRSIASAFRIYRFRNARETACPEGHRDRGSARDEAGLIW